MKIDSHHVIVYTVNPASGARQVVEVTTLLAVPAMFYDFTQVAGDEVDPVSGYITLIGGRTFRLNSIPPERVTQQADGINPVLEVTVPWDQIDWQAKSPPQKAPAAPPKFKLDER